MGNPVGNEIIYANGIAENGQLSGQLEPFSLQQVANLANTEDSSLINTNFTTTATVVLTGAALVGGQITRTGPTANFIDVTDSAADILAALPGVIVGSTFKVIIKNATGFEMLLSAGVNVTLPTNIVIPPFSAWNGFATVTSATAVTFQNSYTAPIASPENLVLASPVSFVSSTALQALTGLSATLLTSGNYLVSASLPVSLANAAGGLQVALVASNNLTATSFTLTGTFYTATGVACVNTTTLGGGVGTSAAIVLAELSGLISVNTGGTITLKAAQNASTTATTTLAANGTLSLTRQV